jgi:DNA replication protein DnaC
MKTNPTTSAQSEHAALEPKAKPSIEELEERVWTLERERLKNPDPIRALIDEQPEDVHLLLLMGRYGKTDEEFLSENPEFARMYQEWALTPSGMELVRQMMAFTEWADRINIAKKELVAEKMRLAGIKSRKRATERIIEQLNAEIGFELRKQINPKHPDLDWTAFKRFALWRVQDTGEDCAQFPNAVISGPQGCGKTRALAYKAFQMAKTHRLYSFAWTTGTKFAELVSSLGQDERVEAKAELKRLAEVDFLFFDDLGSNHFTGPRISHFFSLMDARYQDSLATFFTTNHGVADIRKMLSKGTGRSDDASASDRTVFADRIIRRMIGTNAEPRAVFFKFNGRKARDIK